MLATSASGINPPLYSPFVLSSTDYHSLSLVMSIITTTLNPLIISMDSLFHFLPEELIRLVYSFADIPSLSALSRTSKSPLFQYTLDNTTWSNLVERRFRITTKTSRPKFHGGSTWKDAYRSLSCCNRIPRTRLTTKHKVVFAKRGGEGSENSQNPVSLWALIFHTDNCETRTRRNSLRAGNSRYVCLRLCIQNTKSSGEFSVNVNDASIKIAAISEHCSHGAVSTGSLRPRIVAFSGMTAHRDVSDITDSAGDLTLGPFAFAVVAVHFPCASDMVFETDFLCRAVSVHVPVNSSNGHSRCYNDESKEAGTSHASAFFLPENEVWNYYMQLPGGCLALTDRYRLMTA